MLDHPMSTTTHTVEMAQLNEINDRLTATRNAPVVTAGELGLSGPADSARTATNGLPPSAVLVRVSWDGPPEYPYIHGHFAAAAGQNASLAAELHTAALNELSHLVGLHHRWGV